jgi:regulator of sigma E protease
MILPFLIALASLVGLMVAHEFGHFILAKKFGAKVEEFGIGYPPKIFGKKIGETIYSLNLIPFGAFVRIKGETGGIEDHRSFLGKPMWQRMLIILGGVISFWIVSIILMSVVAGVWGLPTAITDDTAGNFINPEVRIVFVSPDSTAALAGIEVGDTVLNFEKISEFQSFISNHKGEEIVLSIERDKEIIEKTITLKDSSSGGILGVGLTRVASEVFHRYKAPFKGVTATGELTLNVLSGWVLGLKSLFGLVELPEGMDMEMMGPIGIFDLLGDYFSLGMDSFLFLVSLVSVALALANLLPIPALDGGKMVFLAIEAVRGKPINSKIESRITGAFFFLLIALMIFVTIKFDIPRLF